MAIVYHNICTKRTFKTKDGKERTSWFIVGSLKEMDEGKKFIELNMFPETSFYVFVRKPKEESSEFSA